MEAYSKSQHYGVVGRFYSTYVDSTRSPTHNSETGTAGTDFSSASTLSGFRNPKWRDQIRLGQNATTQMSGVQYSGEPSWSHIWFMGQKQNKTTKAVSGSYNYATWALPGYDLGTWITRAAPSDVVTDVTNRCIRRFLDQAESVLSSNNIGIRTAKHFQHDVHTLIHPLTGIRSKINDYLNQLSKAGRSINRRSPGWLRVISESYLEFQFGVSPFVDDISSIVSDLSRNRFPTVPISASATRRYSGTRTTVSTGNWGYCTAFNPYQQVSVTSDYTVRYKGAIRSGSNAEGKVSWFQDERLLPQDWLPSIYSILPYSWMVNYFSNLRDVIDGISFIGSNLAWGCATTIDRTSVEYSDVLLLNDSSVFINLLTDFWSSEPILDFSGGHATFERKVVNRSILTPSGLVPRFQFQIPHTITPYVNMMAAFLPRILALVVVL